MASDLLPFLRPSAAATWVVCNGYARMRSHFPDAPDEADDEIREDGVACHWLASEVWHGRTPKLDSLSPNHRVLDDDMFDAVDLYLDILRSWEGAEVYVEQKISVAAVIPGQEGTPDAWSYNPTMKLLRVADLKYGFRFVEVWENWQMIVYVLSLIALLQLDDRDLLVEFTICQPRSHHRDGPVRKWRVKASDLRAYANILAGAVADANKPDPPCIPNPGCTDCPARHACVALQNTALRALELAYAGVPLELTPGAVGDELRRLEDAARKLDARITGLKTQAESLLRAGAIVPYWGLETAFARLRWREGMEAQIAALGVLFKVNLLNDPKPITPTQAKKTGLPAAILDAYSHKPSTGVKLTRQDPNKARKVFEQ
jgi:hypothetical protein